MSKKTFLFEIGCEELPARAQSTLSTALSLGIKDAFDKANLSFKSVKTYATPRRLAVIVSDLETYQAPQSIEKQGPTIEKAYDKTGSPTLACMGFAKSCGVTLDELNTVDTPKGKRLIFIAQKPGEPTAQLLPEILSTVVSKLPLSKPMRWGSNDVVFVRPVHWIVALFGQDVIPVNLFGIDSGRASAGHRFHHAKSLCFGKAEDYNMVLYSQGYVIADFEARKKLIAQSMLSLVSAEDRVVENKALLNEVTALVEWPVVLKGSFDAAFLSVPKEALITAMETHQKCFSIVDAQNNLRPNFLLISNIESNDPDTVIKGNERVIRARLSDAQFFYNQDKKTTLAQRLPKLDHIIFQKQLGSLGEKTNRINVLSDFLAATCQANINDTQLASTLCKADLVSEMVYEFTNLQGIMGYHYAKHDGLSEEVALAVREHYLPRFSGDSLPSTLPGCCIALADRIDTIVGIIGINKTPTGDKDPFALRRAALGIIRILIEKNLTVDLYALIEKAVATYSFSLPNPLVIQSTLNYIMTRLKSWYVEQNVSPEVFEAVLACEPKTPVDFHQRIQAVIQFQKLPEATSLAAANKRVSNILKKQPTKIMPKEPNKMLFESDAEHTLARYLAEQSKVVDNFYKTANYDSALTTLSTLKGPIDQFFDDVMIMVDDESVKQNRLALLANIRSLLTKVADISLLP